MFKTVDYTAYGKQLLLPPGSKNYKLLPGKNCTSPYLKFYPALWVLVTPQPEGYVNLRDARLKL